VVSAQLVALLGGQIPLFLAVYIANPPHWGKGSPPGTKSPRPRGGDFLAARRQSARLSRACRIHDTKQSVQAADL